VHIERECRIGRQQHRAEHLANRAIWQRHQRTIFRRAWTG
jgi:hypothetical protein